MSDLLSAVVQRHKAGERAGIPSICSAHPTVLLAAMQQALDDESVLLVEATSNQVDQDGGYTGMTPQAFSDYAREMAQRAGLPPHRLVLGGDHLGPNRWRHEDPVVAMDKAEVLVTAYAAAGYEKIHLDCSMRLVGDPERLPDDVVAARSARLLVAAEAAAPGHSISYVIGTEVPVPGGAHETLGVLTPTPPEAARTTLAAHRDAFADAGLGHVWSRVAALVVQPGVEFDHLQVIDYDRRRTAALQHVLDDQPDMVFEAHSTDYQTPERLAELVEDHWAVLKVGPGLTFALREGLFALAAIERELLPEREWSWLPEEVERRMLAEPAEWERYYEGDEDEQRIARRYSYSDRMRYYWPDPAIRHAEERLYANLEARAIPLPLVSQYLPDQYRRVRAGRLAPNPRDLVLDKVRDALRPYAAACRQH